MKGNSASDDGSSAASQYQLTAFLVDRDMPGVLVLKDQVDKKAGLKGLETCPVTFDNVLHI